VADADRSLHLDVAIADDALDIPAAIESASMTSVGGIAMFIGTVRESAASSVNADRVVTGLDYEAHPTIAAERLESIARAAAERWDVRRIVARHRTGSCEVGEPTVVIACGAPHRADALEACRFIIDEIKSTVPIWKRERYSDGSSWLGAEGSVAGDP
jgi:molybdopterin synthase catalytic subunit